LKKLFVSPAALRKNKKKSKLPRFLGVVVEEPFCSLTTCHEGNTRQAGAGRGASGPQRGTSYGQLILLGSSPGKLWTAYILPGSSPGKYNSAAKAAEVLLLM
jgi:hypothetical protein